MDTRERDICADPDCGMPIEDALSLLGKQVWQHSTVRIGPGDENVPGTWTSSGTQWVPDHLAKR